jgi:hypothetical protein
MDNLLLGMSFFLALCFGVVSYLIRRRGMIRRGGTSQPMPPTPARPGPLLWFKMIAPTRPTRILLGIAGALIAAGFLLAVVTVNFTKSSLTPLYIATALIGLGSAIDAYLVLAFAFRRR